MGTDNTHIIPMANKLLKSGYYGILGLKKRWGMVGPYVFTGDDDLNQLVFEPRYPMVKILRELLKAESGKKFGVVARGCDIRAAKALAEDRYLDLASVAFIGVICSEEQAVECNCEKPVYDLTKCTGCWECVENCPEEAISISSCCPVVLPNEFDEGLSYRRAI